MLQTSTFPTWRMDAAVSWSRLLHPSLPQGPCVLPQPRAQSPSIWGSSGMYSVHWIVFFFFEDPGCKVVLGFCQSKLCKFPKVEAFLPTEDQKKGSLLVFPCCIETGWGAAECQRSPTIVCWLFCLSAGVAFIATTQLVTQELNPRDHSASPPFFSFPLHWGLTCVRQSCYQ